MPILRVTVQVNGRPLRRAYVEHLVLGVGQDTMYITDDNGIVRSQAGNPGIDSFTRNADIRVLCQNSVVKVLDGNTPGFPLAVNQDFAVIDGSVVNINTNAEQDDHYAILNRCLLSYDVVFRQFRPFATSSHSDFPLGRKATLRATKDQANRIEVSFPSQFPLGNLAFSEPKSAATGYPLIHIRGRATDGRLFGEFGSAPTLIPSELAHALHFSIFSAANRQMIQNDYIGWISSDIANGGTGTHAMGVRTSHKVAFIEALDQFSSRFAKFVRDLQPGNSTLLQQQAMTTAIRQDFFRRELSGAPVTGAAVATLGPRGEVIPNFTGPDDEGAIYGCIFVDFARRVGLREAVNGYLRSASSGAITFGEYLNWFRNNRPQYVNALVQAQQTWGL